MIVSITDLFLCQTPVFFALRAIDSRSHATLDAGRPDLNRFSSAAYEQSLRRLLKKKYHDRSMGAAVAVGTGILEFVLCSWPGIRVVLARVDQIDFTRSKLP
jgi:hypothetical protein